MSQGQFIIKYRYQTQNDILLQGSEDKYEWYKIDISNQINKGINVLTFEKLVELLNLNNAQFTKNNIIYKQNLQWRTINDNDFEIDFTKDHLDYQEIYLLLKSQNFISLEISDIERIFAEVNRIQQTLDDFVRNFSLEKNSSQSFVQAPMIQIPDQKQIIDLENNQYENPYDISQMKQKSISNSNKYEQDNNKNLQIQELFKFVIPNEQNKQDDSKSEKYFDHLKTMKNDSQITDSLVISSQHSGIGVDDFLSDSGQIYKDEDASIQSRESDLKTEEEITSEPQQLLLDIISPQNTIKSTNMTDMIFLYSEPLVYQYQCPNVAQPTLLPAGDPVEYKLEIQKICEAAKVSKKQINLETCVATLYNLERALTKNIQILHIACHGENSEEKQYLAFEDQESKLDMVTIDRFLEFLKNKECNIKLLFLNACYSGFLGEIFSNSGIQFVIVVQQDVKIEENAALTFSSIFYENIFTGRSVQESFDRAINTTKGILEDNCFTSCCAHSHIKSCRWFNEVKRNKLKKSVHQSHEPPKECKCPNAKRRFHKLECKKARKFLKRYKDDYKIYIQEIKKQKQELFVCCCKTILTPHDESQKFKLIKNPNSVDCQIINHLPDIVEKNNLLLNHTKFYDYQSKIFGR